MRKLTLAAALLAALVPATAQAFTKTDATRYERAYAHAKHVFGQQAVGCQLFDTCHGRVTLVRLQASTAVLRRLFAPPPAPAPAVVIAAPAAYASAAPASSYSATGYSIPASVVQCESGGNWSAVNPSSGAGGAYQITPSTWAAYGGSGSPQDASPAEQTRVAAEVLAGQGPSAWTCWR